MRNRRLATLATTIVAALCGPMLVLAGGGAATADDGARHGLRGDYYTTSGPGVFDFDEHKATVVDSNIEFADLNPTLEMLTGQSDNAAVRWTGQLRPQYSEDYTFSMIGDNGFRLWIDGELVIDNWKDNWDVEKVSQPVSLQADQLYDIKVEYFEHYGGAHLRLRWESASQSKAIIPTDAYYLPEGFDPPGPRSATVSPDGARLDMVFDEELAALPDGAAQNLAVNVGGTEWPVASTSQVSDRPRTMRLHLTEPIPGVGNSPVRASYDGEGGITTADGAAVEAFNVPVENNSTYTITTRWADDVDPDSPLPKYPRPQMVRNDWKNLNGTWQFAAAEAGETPPFGQELAERIVVPFPVESKLSGLQRREDRMWYRRTFTVPDSWDGERLLLHFGAVDHDATVYVNGQQVARHKGGYDAFSADITGAVVPGQTQELVVGVYDPTDAGGQPVGKQRLNPGGIMYTASSGIWQTVWLEPVSVSHISRLDSTPDVGAEELKLTVRADGAPRHVVVATAYHRNRQVGRATGTVGEQVVVPVPDPRLWSTRSPFLYDLEVELRDPVTNEVVDSVDSYFGMREVRLGKVDGTLRILLNGKPVYQHGLLDQGFWPDGLYTAPTDEALKYDLVQTKRMGFNTARKHVKVEPARWYYWADKLGVIVWQDMVSMPRTPDDATKAQFEHELREMVTEHWSHPSILMWVPFNEAWGIYDPGRIADMVKDWDPSRLVSANSGSNNFPPDPGNGDVVDDHIYVGPGTPRPPSETRASVLSEYGGLALSVFGHQWTGAGWGYNTEPDSEALTQRYLALNERLKYLATCEGLSASIYTQTTDVETELNGVMTYDRDVDKMDVGAIRGSNLELINSGSHPECDR